MTTQTTELPVLLDSRALTSDLLGLSRASHSQQRTARVARGLLLWFCCYCSTFAKGLNHLFDETSEVVSAWEFKIAPVCFPLNLLQHLIDI